MKPQEKYCFGAVLPAGGIGARMGAEKPKQLLEIQGKTLLHYAVESFLECSAIAEVVVACPPDWEDWFRDELEPLGVKVVLGGSERWESVRNGVLGLSDKVTHFLAHDVARPFVAESILLNCIESLKGGNSCMVAKPVIDTVQKVENGVVVETLDRKHLVLAQTPQCSSVALIKNIYEKMQEYPNYNPTDEAGMLRFFGEKVCVVEGDDWNDKITRPFDLERFKKMLEDK